MQYQQALELALRGGHVDHALLAARQWVGELTMEGKAPRDAGIEVAKAAATAYRDFATEPVHQFQQQIAATLDGEAGSIVERALKRLMDMTAEWEPKLEMVYRERLARELRDFTRGRHFAEAAQNVSLLCSAARTPEDGSRLARYVGNVLATCDNHPKECETLIGTIGRDPNRYHLTNSLVSELLEGYQQRREQLARSRMETRELEWSRGLTQTVIDLKGKMPGGDGLAEPDEAVVRDVTDHMRAILRIPVWRNQADKLIDATLILIDFTPKELATAAAQSGVEQRAYSTLSYTAKKAAILAFGEIGKSATFAAAYEKFARWAQKTNYAKPTAQFMGATRSPVFYPVLVEFFGTKESADMRADLVDAFGNIGNADARNLLIAELERVLGARAIDASHIREATRIFVSLGKLSKSPRLSAEERADLVRRALKTIPRDQSRLALTAALHFFSYQPANLPAELRQWATTVLTQSLWLSNEAPEWAKGNDRQTELGFRAPIAEALRALVSASPDQFLQMAEQLAMRYSGAYIAVADVCEKTKLTAALPTLEKMLLNAMMTGEGGGKYDAEQVWDPATQQHVVLAKDKVVSALIFAIGSLGGPEALRILQNLDDQIRSGRQKNPGTESTKFLMQFLQQLGANPLAQPGAPGSAAGPAGGGLLPMEEDRLTECIKALEGSYFLTGAEKRRLKKIQALTELAQHCPPEALDALVAQLADKDVMVQGAARSTLGEYFGRRVPPAARKQAIARLVMGLSEKDPAIRAGAAKVLQEVGPGQPDIRAVLEKEQKVADDASIRAAIEALLRAGGLPGGMAGTTGGEAGAAAAAGGASLGNPPGAPASAAGAPGAPATSGAPAKPVSALDLKRQYVLARQEWIRSGKKGPAPEPPPGG